MTTRLALAVAAFCCPAAIRAADAEPLALKSTLASKGVAGKLDHLAVDEKGERLFLANKPNNTLDIFDLKTGKLVKQIADQGKVSGVCYAADLDVVYVGNGAGTCNAFDGKEYKQVFSAKAAGADNVHYHAGNKTVYVAHGTSLTELDAKSGAIKGAATLPGSAHGFSIDEAAGKIYVVLTKPSLIAVVDVAKRDVTDKFPLALGDGSPIDRDPATNTLFVGCPKKPVVIAVDARTGKELYAVEIPAGIDDLHFDAKRNRLYASCSDGNLAVLEKKGEKFEVTSKLKTPKDSRTCVFAGGKLYLGVPRQDGAEGPEVRVFEPRSAK